MAKRFGKSDTFVFTNTLFQRRGHLDTMRTIIFLLYSLHLSISMAETASPKRCPRMCECAGSIVKCNQRDLKQLPKDLPKDVTVLDLSGNNISSINRGAFLQFPKLVKLDLSNNRIMRINNGTFGKNSPLIALNLSNNEITTIEMKALTDLPSLQKLKLDGNGLTSLPNLHLEALKTLDLSQNKLETIPPLTFSDMVPALEVLKLSNNKIKSSQFAFVNLKLKKLYLDNNLLANVNVNWLYGLNELVQLYLQNNRIMNISSETWHGCCENLKVLNLANNNLRRVLDEKVDGNGGRFAKLKSLVLLNLSANGIYEISDYSFQSLNTLQELDLSNNKLSWTAYDDNGTFKGLRNLKKLNLSSNEITSVIKAMFEELPAIEKLDMRDNRIEEVTKNAFTPMTSLVDLQMNSNNLHCVCELRWFSKWLSAKPFSRSSPLKCGLPKKLSGQDFLSVPLKDLVCDPTPRPEIIEHPKKQIAFRGNIVKFSCTIKNGSIDGIKIIWKKDMKDLDTNHSELIKYTQVTDNNRVIYKSVLKLYNVSKARDNGRYQCVIVTRAGEMRSRRAKLEVFVPPRFTSKPGDFATRLGATIRFNCSASGDPEPSISLRKDKDSSSFKHRLDLNGDTFVMTNVTVRDVGLYICSATSKAGSINTTFQINIIGKPVSFQPMLDKITLLHDTVIFACAVRSWVQPKFMWFKDDEAVDFTSENIQTRLERITAGYTEYLVIKSAGYTDAGVYKCLVRNELGSTNMTSRLKVVKDLSMSNNPKASHDADGIDHRTFAVALVFTALFSMVITAFICIAANNVLNRRSRNYNFGHYKTSDNVSDSFQPPAASNDQEYMQVAGETSPGESPRSSSTFVTSSSKTPSDSNVAQTSGSESGSTKNREGSFDGRHSSGVCSMNSSNSSLASTANYRNTYPFSSSSKTFLYPGANTCLHDASEDSTSCASRDHGMSRRTLKYHDQPPSRRKHRSSRSSREREQMHRLYSTPGSQNTEDEATKEGYHTESNTTTI